MALKGCCCCGLRGGALAVGIVFLVLTVLELLGNIANWGIVASTRPTEVASFGIDTPDGRFDARVRQGEFGGDISLDLGKYSGSVSSSDELSLGTPLVDRRVRQFMTSETHYSHDNLLCQVFLAVQTVFVLMALLFNSLLIHGANKSSSCSVLAWLVYYGIMFVGVTLASLALLIACFVFLNAANNGSDWNVDAGTLAAIFGVAGGICIPLSALLWYSWAVVLAFHQQLSAATSGFKYSRDVLP